MNLSREIVGEIIEISILLGLRIESDHQNSLSETQIIEILNCVKQTIKQNNFHEKLNIEVKKVKEINSNSSNSNKRDNHDSHNISISPLDRLKKIEDDLFQSYHSFDTSNPKTLLQKLQIAVDALRKERSLRCRIEEKRTKYENEKNILNEQINKLLRVLKVESIRHLHTTEKLHQERKLNQYFREQNQKQSKMLIAYKKYISALRSGKIELDDEMRLIRSKYEELKVHLDSTRTYQVQTVDKYRDQYSKLKWKFIQMQLHESENNDISDNRTIEMVDTINTINTPNSSNINFRDRSTDILHTTFHRSSSYENDSKEIFKGNSPTTSNKNNKRMVDLLGISKKNTHEKKPTVTVAVTSTVSSPLPTAATTATSFQLIRSPTVNSQTSVKSSSIYPNIHGEGGRRGNNGNSNNNNNDNNNSNSNSINIDLLWNYSQARPSSAFPLGRISPRSPRIIFGDNSTSTSPNRSIDSYRGSIDYKFSNKKESSNPNLSVNHIVGKIYKKADEKRVSRDWTEDKMKKLVET